MSGEYPNPEPTHDYDKKLEVSAFPGNLRRRFKAECARRGQSMSEVLIMLADNWTQEQEQQGHPVERLHQPLGTCWCGRPHTIEEAIEINRPAVRPAVPNGKDSRAG
jgi:signal recognition particle receptor subunit beta